MAVVIKQGRQWNDAEHLYPKAAARFLDGQYYLYLARYVQLYEFPCRSTLMALPYLSLQNLGD